MPSYITLNRFTQTGIENVEASPDRTEDVINLIESLGGELWEFFAVLGRYNGVLITDVPDNETATRATLTLGKSGNVTTEPLKAFDLNAFRKIVAHVDEDH